MWFLDKISCQFVQNRHGLGMRDVYFLWPETRVSKLEIANVKSVGQ